MLYKINLEIKVPTDSESLIAILDSILKIILVKAYCIVENFCG